MDLGTASMIGPESLPVDGVLPALIAALRRERAAVLTAPPGAGKSTRVPLALLEAQLGEGLIVMLQPRRLAARAVARRLAQNLGEPLGHRVGYRVRFEERRSAATRILVVTEGILTRWLLDDPLLEGVSAVILDEFHERSLHADLALAFLRELRDARQDLTLVVMSATLEAEPVCRFLGACPLVSCETELYPLRISYLPVAERRPLAEAVHAGLLALLRREDDDGGNVLVFLPGAGEIRRCLAALGTPERALPGAPELMPLYGALSASAQDEAITPGPRRRVVLCTNIAETSLTVPGVTAVLDSGWAKRPRYAPNVGLDRLELGRVSQASATQRAGRAGRLAPGRVLRLWSEAEQVGLPRVELPEIERLDPSQIVLPVLSFHPGDPCAFEFLTPPASSALAAGLELLRQLGAVQTGGFHLTARGERLARLPVHPRVGALLEGAAERGLVAEGALLAALLSERELLPLSERPPTVDSDLLYRRDLFLELERSSFSPERAAALGIDGRAAQDVRRARDQLHALATRLGLPSRATPTNPAPLDEQLRELLLVGYPDRVCRRRHPRQPSARMIGGHGVKLSEASGVREAELFVALHAEAGPRGLHAVNLVHVASAVSREMLLAQFPALITVREQTLLDEVRGLVRGTRRQSFGDLILEEQEAAIDEEQAAALLARAARERFATLVELSATEQQLCARLQLAARHLVEEGPWPDASPAGLLELLPALCRGRRSFAELRELDWTAALQRRLTARQREALATLLPERLAVPSGRSVQIDYTVALVPGGAPLLAVKLQELFGLAETPRLARGRLLLRLELLAPNGRPVQVTQDLRSFWNTGYAEVRRDLRGRYPKHPWPEDPWSAEPTARTQRKGRR